MKLLNTFIEGLFMIKSDMISDSRGWFFRSYCKKEFEGFNLFLDIVQMNCSHNLSRGTIRGLHSQVPPHAEDKIVRCVRGSVFDVAVDLRNGSKTFLQYYGVELSEDNGLALIVPKGFAHGFQTLTDNSTLVYQTSNYYNKESELVISYMEPKVKINWPLMVSSISDKDLTAPFLGDEFEGLKL